MTAQAEHTERAATFDVRNPATGAVVGTFPVDDDAAVRAQVERAREAQRWWSELGFAGRRPYLQRWVRYLALHCDEIYELGHTETARPRADVQFELFAGLEDVRWAAVHARKVLRERRVAPGLAMANFDARLSYQPYGVVGVITPWNAPVYLTLSGAGVALAAGNAVVVKPSELSPASAIAVLEAFHTANPDAPPALVSWVTGFGETGSALCGSGVDKLAFTGSVPTGRRVMAACAPTLTPVVLELGGKDATIVAADADLEAAAAAVMWGGLFNGGQACVGVERVYVVQEVRDAFLDAVKKQATGVDVGTGPLSAYGPMTTEAQVEIVRRHVTDALAAGAQALVGGPESIRPPYIDPIVLVDVPEDRPAVREETFGPVVVVNTVPDVDEAVRRANSTEFGLGSSVFSARGGPAIARALRAGGTTVNSVLTFVGMSSMPFGGVGSSGFGRFHGADGLREFAYARSVVRKRFRMGPDMQVFPRTPEQFDTVRKTIRLRYGRTFK
ncbi:aldehyde dehydrogenase family protein [Spongisporangium articulatum]|uniref:Aldehyde dehydrogenase n=1 Tax=Spongisporangium articulatum TaxID=3362603 RepID=A0ABW8ATU9_9ACTN